MRDLVREQLLLQRSLSSFEQLYLGLVVRYQALLFIKRGYFILNRFWYILSVSLTGHSDGKAMQNYTYSGQYGLTCNFQGSTYRRYMLALADETGGGTRISPPPVPLGKRWTGHQFWKYSFRPYKLSVALKREGSHIASGT
jgi:hypothetical protein